MGFLALINHIPRAAHSIASFASRLAAIRRLELTKNSIVEMALMLGSMPKRSLPKTTIGSVLCGPIVKRLMAYKSNDSIRAIERVDERRRPPGSAVPRPPGSR